jgi:hypothetical protein
MAPNFSGAKDQFKWKLVNGWYHFDHAWEMSSFEYNFVGYGAPFSSLEF